MIKVLLVTLALGQYTPNEQAFLQSQLGGAAPTMGRPVPPPDYESKAPKTADYEPSEEQRSIYQRREESKAQALRDKWLAQWIVQNRNISPSAVKNQRDMLDALSTKDILNVEKEMNRIAARYMSQKARYYARVAAANRARVYYWRGYRWNIGYRRNYYGGYW